MQPMSPTDRRSIFDKIEEKSPSSAVFAWNNDQEICQFLTEEFIFEGLLYSTSEGQVVLTKHRYILTKKGLIKYNVKTN